MNTEHPIEDFQQVDDRVAAKFVAAVNAQDGSARPQEFDQQFDRLVDFNKPDLRAPGHEALWKAGDICAKAAELVAGDREKTHGNKYQNFTNIARMWNALLAAKGVHMKNPLDAHDVANMMEVMKVARRYSGTVNPDDYIDGAGYAGVAGEVVLR